MSFTRFLTVLSIPALLAVPAVKANLSFNLIPQAGTPQYAVDGFNAAAALWSSALVDNLTVNIQIGYTSLGAGVLGETSSSLVQGDYSMILDALAAKRTSTDDYSSYAGLPGSAANQVGMTTANAKALGLLPQSSSIDALIRFNSDFTFDFTHDSIDAGAYDFVGIAAHEIGHALGFVSGVDAITSANGGSSVGESGFNVLDLFRYSSQSLTGSSDQYFSVDGGATAIASFSTGGSDGDGHQASHWKDNLGLGVMDPTAAAGEKLDISSTDLRAFDVIGYSTAALPEPGMMSLFGLGGGVFWLGRGRFRRKN